MARRAIAEKLQMISSLTHPPPLAKPAIGFSSLSNPTLAFEEVGPPNSSTALILHGLLGCARNWRSFSRTLTTFLSSSSREWRLVLVDLRNHGNSAQLKGFQPPHDMVNTANDLANLVQSQGWDWPSVVIGHSMGGKVALQYAQSCAAGDYGASAILPKQLWVLDSDPGIVSPEDSNGEVEKVLETLQSLPSPLPSRKWLVDHLMNLGFSMSLSQWIGSSLKKSGDKETWAFDVDGAVQMFNSYRETEYWSLLEDPPKGTEISLVRAEKSDRWDADTIKKLESMSTRGRRECRGKFEVHVLGNAGHWVHVDNPKGLLEIIGPRMASLD